MLKYPDSPYFNSRPYVRGDAGLAADETAGRVFQFTPLREGRHELADSFSEAEKFQFTPLREGRPCSRWRRGTGQYNFNSRPYVRGDIGPALLLRHNKFQFTPLREGRPETFDDYSYTSEFQFTPLREGRRVGIVDDDVQRRISIHAPT